MRRTAALSAFVSLFAIGACFSAGCSLITGADALVIEDESAGGGGSGGKSTTSGTPTGSTGSTVSTGTGGTSTGPTGSGGSGTGNPTCNPPCGANQYCETSTLTCQCSPGFISQNGNCEPVPPGDPSTRTVDEVCQKWAQGHVVTTPDVLDASGQDCDAGTLKQGAINDTLTRINTFRWLAGLGPTNDNATMNAGAQLCANLEAWWDFSSGVSPHSPPSSAKCYTAEGASFAGMSNIAWGSQNPAQAIDQFMEDWGNETTMGHRRWIVNPPLSDVGIGYWRTGGQYGDAECLRVFGGGGNGPNPTFVGVPNQGYVPIEVAQWTWTFHSNVGGVPNAQISVLRVDDNAPLTVKVIKLNQGYGQDAISWEPQGFQVEAGKTYRVTVSGLSGGDIVYDVKPVTCN